MAFTLTVERRSNDLSSGPEEPSQASDLRQLSGWRDSNPRPPAPKAGALTKLRYIPWGHRSLPPGRPGTRRGTVRYAGAARPPRGRSSMAELQPSKLVMRVRFPSPAPPRHGRSGPLWCVYTTERANRRQGDGPQTGLRRGKRTAIRNQQPRLPPSSSRLGLVGLRASGLSGSLLSPLWPR